nr:helix-turn-helix transcriptional regulator [uncultured Pseudoxanthomonas sp.]
MSTINFNDLLAEQSPEIKNAIEERFRSLLEAFPLGAMRNDCNVSQAFLASTLGISQAAVSKMESRGDMLVSTFFRYVKALGGAPHLGAKIGDCVYAIEPVDSSARAFRAISSKRNSREYFAGFAETKLRQDEDAKQKTIAPWIQRNHGGVAVSVSVAHGLLDAVANESACDDYYAEAA